MKRLSTFVLVVALAAVGCKTPPPPAAPESPVDLPGNWTTRPGPEEFGVTETWWQDFGDPVLDQIVGEALANNPSLLEAEARVRQAAAQAVIAGARLSPFVGAGAQIGGSERFIGKSEFAEPTLQSQSHGVSLNFSWELDLWARIRSGQAAAVADVEASRAFYHGARLSLAAQTAKAYLAVVESERQVKVAEDNLASAEGLLERIRDRFREGLRTALDLKFSETEVSSAAAQLTARRRVLDATKRQLETLLARYPDATLIAAAGLPDAPPPVPTGIPADVLARRPDLVAAEKQYVAAFYRVAEAEKSLYPRISLTGDAGLASSALEDVVAGDFGVWSLVGSLTQPVFEGGRLRANIRGAKAREEERVAAFANSVLRALAEVEISLAADGFLARQETEIAGLVEESQASVDLSEERFLSGLASFLGVLEARRRFFVAQSELLRTRLDRLNSRIDLYVALGGGFHRDRVTVVEEKAP
jgi:NodT family efflux transporter outer membrane factor (OMF) lipoprotein